MSSLISRPLINNVHTWFRFSGTFASNPFTSAVWQSFAASAAFLHLTVTPLLFDFLIESTQMLSNKGILVFNNCLVASGELTSCCLGSIIFSKCLMNKLQTLRKK
ncbi:hypothetical protein BLOT_011148 [Blomia tropicalis]|nr:hypothetical protein BLOT_011148 [Blomia tropicalis]